MCRVAYYITWSRTKLFTRARAEIYQGVFCGSELGVGGFQSQSRAFTSSSGQWKLGGRIVQGDTEGET